MRTILLVDDDKMFRSSVRRLLRRSYAIHEASDGDEALDFLSRHSVDAVITDVLMPVKDGLELIREIRERWPKLRIIATSGGGYCHAGMYLDLSLKMGARCAIKKPFANDELQAALELVMDGLAAPAAVPAG